MATIGRRAAVVNLKHLQLTGPLGWLFWSVVHIYFLIGARSRFVVAFSWAWQYATFQRGARLITGTHEGPERREIVQPSRSVEKKIRAAEVRQEWRTSP